MERRYGTFDESQSSATNTPTASSFATEDAVSQITITSTFADDRAVRNQEKLRRNRLPVFCESVIKGIARKETLTLLLALHSVILGLFILSTTYEESSWGILAQYLVTCGMLGFVGASTNWLIVGLVFTRSTSIVGVGIVAKHYREICFNIKESIINVILDDSFLELYTKQKLGHYIVALDIEGRLNTLLESEPMKYIINEELHNLATSPEGQILSSIGVDVLTLKPLVGPFIVDITSELIPEAIEKLTTDSKVMMILNNNYEKTTAKKLTQVLQVLTSAGKAKELCVKKIKQELNKYLTNRIQTVNSEQVTMFVETSLRTHLGWLVVIGCVTGVMLGLLSRTSGIALLIW